MAAIPVGTAPARSTWDLAIPMDGFKGAYGRSSQRARIVLISPTRADMAVEYELWVNVVELPHVGCLCSTDTGAAANYKTSNSVPSLAVITKNRVTR